MCIWLEKPYDGYRWFWSQVERCYPVFLRHLQVWHLQAMAEPPGRPKVLSTFYATMMVFVCQSILHDLVSIPVEPVPEVGQDGCPTKGSIARLCCRPITLILEEPNRALYGLLDYFWGINFDMDLQGKKPFNSVSQRYVMLVANLVPKYNGRSTLVDITHEFIGPFLRKVGAEFRPSEN